MIFVTYKHFYAIVCCLIAIVHCLPVQRLRNVGIRSKLSSNGDADAAVDGDAQHGRWKNAIIPYVYSKDSVYSEQQLSTMRQVMDYIESKSCVKFIAKNEKHIDYLEISEPGNDCSSEVGRIGGKQMLHLDAKHCMQKGKILHELMHTLGFIHEHTRTDRDQYISIDWDNVDDDFEHNFDRSSNSLNANQYLNASYDYESIMHYTPYSYAVDLSKPSIVPKQRVNIKSVGKAKTIGILSDIDIKKLKSYYNC